VIVIKENKTSLPMMLLSRHIRKEAQNDNSYKRARKCYKYLSSGVGCGHEEISHGPPFSQQARQKRWSAWYTVLVSLLMVFDNSSTLRDRFVAARRCLVDIYGSSRRPGKTFEGFISARNALSARAISVVHAHLGQQHRKIAGKFWQRLGWEVFAADGSRIEMPRTAANERAFGCAGKKKTGPQLLLTTLYQMGTGLPWDWHIGKGTESERTHLRSMLAGLPKNALLVADAGFTGYELLKDIIGSGRHFLIRVGASVTLLRDLGLESKIDANVVWLWPSGKRSQPPLKLRLIVLEVANNSKMPVYLLTDVFDKEQLSDETAAVLYQMRWGVEVFYRGFKRTLDQHTLRSRSPHNAKYELHWAMTAYLLLGLMSAEGMIAAGTDPLELSVAAGLRTVRTAMQSRSGWRYKGDLRKLLATATKDKYYRMHPKTARDWPHKKNDPPCGIPKIRTATTKEIYCVQRFYDAA
jgi:hypothetical protein